MRKMERNSTGLNTGKAVRGIEYLRNNKYELDDSIQTRPGI
jgi:hypothetical protein